MKLVSRIIGAALLGVIAVPAVSFADTAWTPSSGSNVLYTWAGGYNTSSNLFGSPVQVGTSFHFSPTAFTATNPVQDTATDTMQVTITVQPGQLITGVIINEVGNRTSTNRTTVQGTMRVKDLTVGSLDDFTTSMTYVNDTSTAPIGWSGAASVTGLNFAGGLTFQLTLTNNLTALLQGQSISKTGVDIIFTPAPSAFIALTGFGGLVITRRRR